MEAIQFSNARSNASVRIRPRRAGVPCVRCRQMKVKCNAHSSFPGPCSGCEKVGRRCCIDPSFKRTLKREKKIEKQVKPGQQTCAPSGSVGESPLSQGVELSISPELRGPDVDSLLNHQISELRTGNNASRIFMNESKGVMLNSFVVAALLEEYYKFYHAQFPLIYDPGLIIECHETCPLLFWVVMTIASRYSRDYLHLYQQIQDLVKHLIADEIVLGSRSIFLVQALLLLCVWPFPHDTMNKDSSSIYCGFAITMAKLLGLHRPQHPFRFFSAKDVEIGDFEARQRTWIACFIVDQWHTARFGVPAILRADHTILHALRGHSAVMDSQLQIAYITSKFSMILGECETSSTGLLDVPIALIRTIDTELNMLQERDSETWSPATEISFLDARLGLYSYIISQDAMNSTAASPYQRPGSEFVTLGSITAVQLLLVFSTFPEQFTRGMFHTLRSITYAVFFLLRISGTAHKDLIDKIVVRNALSQTWTLMKKISKTENDQWAKTCKIIAVMINYEDWDKETPPPGKPKSFMANNFISDVAVRGIFRMREKIATARAEHNMNESNIETPSEFDMDFAMLESFFELDDGSYMW